MMKAVLASLPLVVLTLTLAANGRAQDKTLTSDSVTRSGTVEAIDWTNRVLTLRDKRGDIVTVDVPESVKRLDDIRVGDTVTARYYDMVTLQVKQTGEPDVDTLESGATPGTGETIARTAAKQRRMTAVVEAIDPKVPSITFKGPQGWKYSRRVTDKSVLKMVKVGDKVDFTWTEAVMISVTTRKR